MLVQTAKAKRPWLKNNNKRTSVGITKNDILFMPNNSSALNTDMPSKSIECRVLNEDTAENSSAVYVDEKYRDFYRKMNSERVLKVIDSVMKESRTNISSKSSSKASKENKSHNNTRKDFTHMQGVPQCKDKHMQMTNPEEFQRSMQELAQENNELKGHISHIYELIQQLTSLDNDDELNTATENVGHQNETKESDQKTYQLKDNMNNESQSQAKFSNGAMKYLLSMYNKRSGKLNSVPSRDDHPVERERIQVLESLLFEIKLENLRERTEKEKLKLEIDRLEQCFADLKENYKQLTENCKEKIQLNNKRIEKVFDKLHLLEGSKRKRSTVLKRISSLKLKK